MILLFILSLGEDIDFDDLYNKATTLLVQFKTQQDSAFDLLVDLGQDSISGDTTISFLVGKFDTKHAIERHRLKDIFKAVGTSTVPIIVEHLDYRGCDAEDRHLKQSLWVMGEIGGDEIIEPVVRFLNDHDWRIRSGAFTALGKSKSTKALPYITQGLNDSVDIVRKSVYFALSKFAGENEIPQLIAGLNDRFFGVRYASIKGLENIGEVAVEPLLESIDKKDNNDYFIFFALTKLAVPVDTLLNRVEIMQYDEIMRSAIKLLIYESVDSETKIKILLESEENEFLKNYLKKRIIEQYTTP